MSTEDDMVRLDWDSYFLNIAEAVSLRGDCCREQVGAVVVSKDHRIVSTGYNGSPPGSLSCAEGFCSRCASDAPSGQDYDSCIEIHAEMNAIIYADRKDLIDSKLYTTRPPCHMCVKVIQASGLFMVIYPEGQTRV